MWIIAKIRHKWEIITFFSKRKHINNNKFFIFLTIKEFSSSSSTYSTNFFSFEESFESRLIDAFAKYLNKLLDVYYNNNKFGHSQDNY